MKKETKNKVEVKEEKQKKAHKDMFLDYMPYLIIILIVIFIRTYIATPVRVNGTSMVSTLDNGETVILNKLALKIKGINRWDIVVVKTGDTYLVKRIIGMPGETIKYEDGALFINNKEMEDDYSYTITEDFEEHKIGPNEYFVLGDNRYISKDSRVIGNIKKSEIKGKTNLILFPLDRFGIIKQ